MAVYTHVDEKTLRSFLTAYDIGTAISLKGIAEGVENTNYLLETTASRYILTLYEKRVNEADLPFFLSLMRHMAKEGLPSARPVANRHGNTLGSICERTAAIIEFVPGLSIDAPDARNCYEMGKTLAKAHRATSNFKMSRPNTLSLDGWHGLARKCGTQINQCANGLEASVNQELSFLTTHWPSKEHSDLPSGVIHADFFPDNVMFADDGSISGLIDFYFACYDFYAYDLAICINAWCFSLDDEFVIERAQGFIDGYVSTRVLTIAEINFLPIFLRGAALRFLLTRAYDWLNQVPGAVVNVKDPREYLRKLAFHQTHPAAITGLIK